MRAMATIARLRAPIEEVDMGDDDDRGDDSQSQGGDDDEHEPGGRLTENDLPVGELHGRAG